MIRLADLTSFLHIAFKCDVPSCGRLFSVVSNLRRHGKVHMKDHNTPQTPSEADSSEDASEDASNHE